MPSLPRIHAAVFAVKHQLADLSRLVFLRDRLRCPACGAVGTYKPHGGWLDLEDNAGRRRWLCKWCGHYCSAGGCDRAAPSRVSGCWKLISHWRAELQVPSTPQELSRPWNPWRG